MLRTLSRGSRWWIAVVQIVLLLATFVVPAAAATPKTPLTQTQLVQLLQYYQIVKGDNLGNLNLDKPIKRAEMITIMVRALGMEADAQLYKGWGNFADAKGHWAEGNITYAAFKKLVKGDGNNLVRPEDNITYAEAITLVLRLIGKEPVTGEWPINVLIDASTLGLMPPGITAGDVKSPAIRGLVFQSLAQAITTVETEPGKTFLQTYLDSTPPVLTVDQTVKTTKDGTLRITGTVKDADSVTINGKPATVTGSLFAGEATLEYGENALTIQAVDKAGNPAQEKLSVTRLYPISRIEITGPSAVRINESVVYTVTGYDDAGKAVPVTEYTVTATGNIGTYNASSKTFTASGNTGSGALTFKAGTISKKLDVSVLGPSSKVTSVRIKAVNNGQAVPVTRPMNVEVQVLDIDGNPVTDDNGREIELLGTGVGLTVTPTKAMTKDGVATFSVVGTSAGQITLTARSNNIMSSIAGASFATSTHVVLRSEYGSLVLGGTPSSTRIYAELRDDSGNLVNNDSGSDLTITLSQSGAIGQLLDNELSIRRGYSTSNASGNDGLLSTASNSLTGQILITGMIGSGHSYSVQPATLWAANPSVGVGSKVEILNINPPLTPNGAPATVTLRVVDAAGTVITNGNFAFLVKVDTSNNEVKTNGLPAGITLTLGGTPYIPAETGVAPIGNYVYGRTVNGVATLQVGYNKSGVVTLTPVLMGSVNVAFGHDGTSGPSNGSSGFTPVAERILFSGAVASLGLTVDSALGNNQKAGSVSANTGNYFTLRATVLDGLNGTGGKVPGTANNITLAPVGAANYTNALQFPSDTQPARDGVVEFRIYAKASVGCDTYQVTTSGVAGQAFGHSVRLCVTNQLPAEPRIITTRGNSGINNRIGAIDSQMEVELDRIVGTMDNWVSVLIYQDGALVYTTDSVDMNSSAPRVTVPKSYLGGGTRQVTGALKNGAGVGPRSTIATSVIVDYETSAFGIYTAKYDASSTISATTGHKLVVNAYGLNNTVGFAQIDTGKLILRDANQGTTALTGTAYTIISPNQFVVDLATAPSVLGQVESSLVSGNDITLEAGAGWYTQSNGATGQALSGKPVAPFGDITSVTFDVVTSQVLVRGNGLLAGNIDLSKLSIGTVSMNNANVSTWTRPTDSLLVITLTPTGATAVRATGVSDTLTAALGWLSDGGFMSRAISSVPVTAKVALSSVTYIKRVTGANPTPAQLIIRGSGFFNGGNATQKGSVDLSQLIIKDLSPVQSDALTGPGALADVVSDGEIRITLDDTDANLFETVFGGPDIYVQGNTGWFKDVNLRPAEAMNDRYFRLTIN